MSEQAQEQAQTTSDELTATTTTTTTNRFVDIAGIKTNFGKRANLLTSVDETTNTVTFKLFTGDAITWNIPFINDLSGFVKTVYIYGLVAKVKSSLAPVKLEALKETIEKVIASLNSGVLTGRVSTADSLSREQRAYAFIKSIPGGRHFSEAYAHWSDLDSPSVIAEVIAVWAGFNKTQRNAIRKNPTFKIEYNHLLELTESDLPV